MGVAAQLDHDVGPRAGRQVRGHGQRRAAIERERRDGHARVADRHQLRDAGRRLPQDEVHGIPAIGGRRPGAERLDRDAGPAGHARRLVRRARLHRGHSPSRRHAAPCQRVDASARRPSPSGSDDARHRAWHNGAMDDARQAELDNAWIDGAPRHDAPIHLAPYDAGWPVLYEREAARIRAALGARVRLLEHAGSTSVPGLSAKPVIDIVLAVPDSADEDAYVPDMVAAGYRLDDPRAGLVRAPPVQGPGHEHQPPHVHRGLARDPAHARVSRPPPQPPGGARRVPGHEAGAGRPHVGVRPGLRRREGGGRRGDHRARHRRGRRRPPASPGSPPRARPRSHRISPPGGPRRAARSPRARRRRPSAATRRTARRRRPRRRPARPRTCRSRSGT